MIFIFKHAHFYTLYKLKIHSLLYYAIETVENPKLSLWNLPAKINNGYINSSKCNWGKLYIFNYFQ